METLDTLRECHRIVWRYRAELEPYWKIPDRLDSMRFAVTEAAEALDAQLRLNGAYARNRDKDLSVLDELADCALMLITAMGPKAEPPRRGRPCDAYTLEGIIHNIAAMALREDAYLDGECAPPLDSEVWRVVARLRDWSGMDLPARLTARLERIKRKRLPQPAADLDTEYTWTGAIE